MNINRKIELAEQALRSLTTHDDVDVAVRHAALDRINAFIQTEREGMNARVQAKIDAAVCDAPAPTDGE